VRAEEEARPALEQLRGLGADVLYVRADIGDDDAPQRLIGAVSSRFGRLDLLVNNAGVAPKERKDIIEATQESFDRVLRINLRGPYFLTQAAARFMRGAAPRDPVPGGAAAGCIVFITSMSAAVASVNRGEYCVSKAGLSMASLLWATRLAGDGISVFEVRPGIIRTDMTAAVMEKYDRLIDQGLTLQNRWGTPQDVGRAVAMLARGDLPYSTGQVILVDGGLTVQRL
jgi:NAD(P)-dependent dehydrogenase (short-subunit alcohol dehydrogenase family)